VKSGGFGQEPVECIDQIRIDEEGVVHADALVLAGLQQARRVAPETIRALVRAERPWSDKLAS
jgi:hypothetical protein